ncbi:16S rRNA (cytosine(1402)-N(4))-methyltransferase RsmH [Methylovirgula sp. HY1]|uniref:16S rRNA (cytosine(1402)-N(4))-methyltransferase RsmH n=1 Tax=Methylovirgula sp. HY1 TaxID=2822761 RepID=UPI001C5B7864|nr:16S rRNA (cytosine(1402)-N(4))-methyltransferase RsmH [Methylovirgula sp. HY1]QXX74558.1 Ribosomal RNA small subunit methyltransferase H [Methylovirgula sp. HY1]
MTAGRGEEQTLAAGGPARHLPVLRDEILAALNPKGGEVFLDATFGAGGYTRAILSIEGTRVLAIDRDPTAIAAGQDLVIEAQGRLTLVRGVFSALESIAQAQGIAHFDGVVFDIGVSSMQIDDATRGFSFRYDGPLDMRMECAGPSAADLVNGEDEARLADILYYFGEERASRRIAKAIAVERARAPFTTTMRLAETIAAAAPAKPSAIHPATRSFQALRIAVNDELGELVKALVAAERMLGEGGRLAVVTFHSLEDRIVKQFFASRSGHGEARSRLLPGEPERPVPTFIVPAKQPVLPSETETRRNPRARSAKLRFATRTAAPARAAEPALALLAQLPPEKIKSTKRATPKQRGG